MHIDKDKTFDKRNIARNIKNGVISQKDYEFFLSKLPDVSTKSFNPEETPTDSGEAETREVSEATFKKKAVKKKTKGKGK